MGLMGSNSGGLIGGSGESESAPRSSPLLSAGHSPGPWQKRGGMTPGYVCIVDANNRYIVAEMATSERIRERGECNPCVDDMDEQAANARVMAAAPELIEALRELADFSVDDSHYRRAEKSKKARETAYALLERLGG